MSAPRIHSLHLAQNQISSISPSLPPNVSWVAFARSISSWHTDPQPRHPWSVYLEAVEKSHWQAVLTDNLISSLATLLPLETLTHLRHLSLKGNPVTEHEHYEPFVIFKVSPLDVKASQVTVWYTGRKRKTTHSRLYTRQRRNTSIGSSTLNRFDDGITKCPSARIVNTINIDLGSYIISIDKSGCWYRKRTSRQGRERKDDDARGEKEGGWGVDECIDNGGSEEARRDVGRGACARRRYQCLGISGV